MSYTYTNRVLLIYTGGTIGMGRNPKTMEEALISSRKSLTFRPSPILKKIVNEKQ